MYMCMYVTLYVCSCMYVQLHFRLTKLYGIFNIVLMKYSQKSLANIQFISVYVLIYFCVLVVFMY